MADLINPFSRTIFQYQLFQRGARILIAVSGGLDSLVLAQLFQEYRYRLKGDLSLGAAYVEIPQVALAPEAKENLARELDLIEIPFVTLPATLSEKAEFRCYTCARERRKQLCLYCQQQGFDAVAFGHTRDDYLETGLMNLIYYHGRLETLQVREPMFKGLITVIRPLIEIPKKHIIAFANARHLPNFKQECLFAEHNKREFARQLIQQLRRQHRAFPKNLEKALRQWADLSSTEN
jgi:tRNA 2-thiocytidine biosynthesis protein TtcA